MVVSENMFLLMVLVLSGVHYVKLQPIACLEDSHCSVGYFCLERLHTCHECLSCEGLGRSQSDAQDSCIKSGEQCGPCLQGLSDDKHWDGMCIVPETRSYKFMSSYVGILLVACITSGLLLSLFIVHGIWNTHVMAVVIAMSSSKIAKVSKQTSAPKQVN